MLLQYTSVCCDRRIGNVAKGANLKKMLISITNSTYKKLPNLDEFRIGNQIKIKLNPFMDTLISNFIDCERKTPIFITEAIHLAVSRVNCFDVRHLVPLFCVFCIG
jgi:hypothetical protein